MRAGVWRTFKQTSTAIKTSTVTITGNIKRKLRQYLNEKTFKRASENLSVYRMWRGRKKPRFWRKVEMRLRGVFMCLKWKQIKKYILSSSSSSSSTKSNNDKGREVHKVKATIRKIDWQLTFIYVNFKVKYWFLK